MKRITVWLLTVAAVLSVLSGCHGARGLSPFVLPEEFDSSRSYEITFWAKNDTNVTQTRIYEAAIRDFQALYPNITVKLKLYTDYGKIYSDVITNIATGTTPNVCITYPDHIATYRTGGYHTVVPLDGLMAHGSYGLGAQDLRFDAPAREEMVDKFLEECRIDGEQYALPYMRSTEACYVNRDYVEKLGFTLPETLTWDFVLEVSRAAMQKDEEGNFLVNGQKTMIPFIYKSTDNMMIQMLCQKQAGYSNEAGEILLFNDTTKELLSTLAPYAEERSFSTFKISSYPANFLNAGQCIFAVDSTAGATWMGSKAPLLDIPAEQLVDFETVVMSVPQFEPDEPRMISQGPSVCVFNKEDPQEVVASWLFCQYLLTNEVQIAYSQTEGYVPVTQQAQNSPEYQDYLAGEGREDPLYYPVKLRAAKLLLENTHNTFVTPVFNGSAALRNAAGQLVEETAKAVRRGQEADEAFFLELFDQVRSLYRLDQLGRTEPVLPEGGLPLTSVVLLGGLGTVWLCLAASFLAGQRKKRKNRLGT